MEPTPQQETEYITEHFPKLLENFPLYAYLNLKIKNKRGQVVRFRLNRMQRALAKQVREAQLRKVPLRFYFIKSRQTGSTTFWLGLVYYLCSLWKNKNGILVAHDDEASTSLGDKLQNFYMRSHRLLKPNARKMNRNEVYFANSLEEYEKTGDIGHDCHIDNNTADNPSLGRSYTYQYALLTELGIWEEKGIDCKVTLSALFQTIPDIPESLIVIETTVKGEGFAKDFWEDKKNGFVKIFISWIADEEYRFNLPLGENYFDLSEEEETVYGNELKVKEIIEQELLFWDADDEYKDNPLALYHETMCRLAWRRHTIDTKCFGDKVKFKQEYPLTIQDAFANESSYVFPISKIEELERNVEENNIKPTNYNYIYNDAITAPTKKFAASRFGKLKVFEPPELETHYVIGGDGAQGLADGDYSSLVVLKVPDFYEVASFQDRIAPTEFGSIGYYLSKLYNNALLGIEVNDKGGYAAIESIKENYPTHNLFYRKKFKQPNTPQEIRYGWITNEITRSVMIEDLASLLRGKHIEIFNPTILDQLRTFIKHKNGKMAAQHGKHDDFVIALMVAIQMARQIKIAEKTTPPARAPKGSADWLFRQMQQRRKGLRLRTS